jgi:hypothetical protein
MQDRPGPFTLREGAAALGVSLNTLRRRIAAGQVRAERVERAQGFVWQVYPDGAAPSRDGARETVQRDRPGTVQQAPTPPTALAQAEAMAAYTRSLLEPLVAHVGELEGTVRDQAETIGRLTAELAAERAKSLTDASTAPGSENLTLEPLSARWRQPWPPWPLLALGAAVAVIVVLVVLPMLVLLPVPRW